MMTPARFTMPGSLAAMLMATLHPLVQMAQRRGLSHGQAVAVVGERIKSGLQREWSGLKGVVEIRGQGLMLGIELDRPCGGLLQRAADAGLLISVTADTVIRLLPPLTASDDEITSGVGRLELAVHAALA